MRIISKRKLREYWEDNPIAREPLDEWYRKLNVLSCGHLVGLRRVFPHADIFGTCTIFNVGGNKYRVITWVNYQSKQVYIRHVLTHREYDDNKWKTDCIKR